MIGRSEIALDAGSFFDGFVVMKLGAVVERDGVEAGLELADGLGHGPGGFGHVASFEFLDDKEAGDPFDEGQDTVALVSTHDGIAFPMPLLTPHVDFHGTLTDMPLAEQPPACSGASSSFTTELAQDAQVHPQLTARSTVAPNVAVDGFLAHHQLARQAASPDNLSWAPQALQRPLNGLPILSAKAAIAPASPAPGDGILMSFLGSIGAVVAGGVAAKFAADGGRRPTDDGSDEANTSMLAEKPPDNVSFLLGELAVSHVSNPFLPDEEADSIAGSPPSLDGGVALSLANRAF